MSFYSMFIQRYMLLRLTTFVRYVASSFIQGLVLPLFLELRQSALEENKSWYFTKNVVNIG